MTSYGQTFRSVRPDQLTRPAEGVLRSVLSQSSGNGIAPDVAFDATQIIFLPQDPVIVAPMPESSASACLVTIGRALLEEFHEGWERRLFGPYDEQMEVIRHETKRLNGEAVSQGDNTQDVKRPDTIGAEMNAL